MTLVQMWKPDFWGFLPNPMCIAFGHRFVQRGGVIYCTQCGKRVT